MPLATPLCILSDKMPPKHFTLEGNACLILSVTGSLSAAEYIYRAAVKHYFFVHVHKYSYVLHDGVQIGEQL